MDSPATTKLRLLFAANEDPRLTEAARRVLAWAIKIVSVEDKGGWFYASLPRIARTLLIHEATARRGRDRLLELGYFQPTGYVYRFNGGSTPAFAINWKAGPPPSTDARGVGATDADPPSTDARGVSEIFDEPPSTSASTPLAPVQGPPSHQCKDPPSTNATQYQGEIPGKDTGKISQGGAPCGARENEGGKAANVGEPNVTPLSRRQAERLGKLESARTTFDERRPTLYEPPAAIVHITNADTDHSLPDNPSVGDARRFKMLIDVDVAERVDRIAKALADPADDDGKRWADWINAARTLRGRLDAGDIAVLVDAVCEAAANDYRDALEIVANTNQPEAAE